MARVKRQKINVHAGRYFKDDSSELINSLKNEGKKALIGIGRDDGVYTVLGEEYVYYCTTSGKKYEMLLQEFSDAISHNAIMKRKWRRFKYMKVNGEKVWLHNRLTMYGLMNVMNWLVDEKERSSN